MYPVISACPICAGEIIVTTLSCRECETEIKGRFVPGPFSVLSMEQLEFVEAFIRNEGKINRMEADIGLSYPTIRNRLHQIIVTLGYEIGEDKSGLSEEERREILQNLDEGKIDHNEAMTLILNNKDSQ